MVPTCVIIALFLPLLVKATESENGNVYFDPVHGSYRNHYDSATQPSVNPGSAHLNLNPLERPPSAPASDSGNHGPLHASAPNPAHPLTRLAFLNDAELMAILDRRFHVDKLPPDATYRIKGDSTNRPSPIPTDDYYRKSPKIVIEIRGAEYQVNSRRGIFRSYDANILRQRLDAISESSPIHLPPIRHLLAKIQTSYDNDDSLGVSVFPLGSHWYLPPNHTPTHAIADNEYIQVPPNVVVTTRVGTFQLPGDQIFVRSVEYHGVNDAAFALYQRKCERSYRRKQCGRTDSTFVERCTKNAWERAVTAKGPPVYRAPAFKPDLPRADIGGTGPP